MAEDTIAEQLQEHERRLNTGGQTIDQLRVEVAELRQLIQVQMQEQARQLAEIKELLVTWNNIKGFVKTMRMLAVVGKVVGWVVGVAAALYMLGKTGSWTLK